MAHATRQKRLRSSARQLYVRDETLEVTTVELAAFDPKTGWQSARTESDHQYYLRMADPNVLEWAFLKEDAPVTARKVRRRRFRGDEITGLGV